MLLSGNGGKDNTLKTVDMGLVHSSAAPDMATLIINHLRQTDDLVTGVSPSFLVKHWPPAFKEWATKSVRDAFFASPQFPRILSADAIRDTSQKNKIWRGNGKFWVAVLIA